MSSSTKRTKSAAILRLKQKLSRSSICTMEAPQLRHGVAITSLLIKLGCAAIPVAMVAILVIQHAVNIAAFVALRALTPASMQQPT